MNAFHEPDNILERKKLSRILSKPLPEVLVKQLFDYDAYLRCLGRMSLSALYRHYLIILLSRNLPQHIDLEAHGGLYTLHSHLNHSCIPNVSVRHLDTSKAISRITLLAKSDISIGEELVITYVDPDMGVNERRRELRSWGFGACMCKRCVEEEETLKMKEVKGEEGGAAVDPDLEDELRAGFGIV